MSQPVQNGMTSQRSGQNNIKKEGELSQRTPRLLYVLLGVGIFLIAAGVALLLFQ